MMKKALERGPSRAMRLQRHSQQLHIEEAQALLGDRWFQSLSETLQAKLVQFAAVRRLPARTNLGSLGAVPEVWFAVASGAVKLSCYSRDGRETVVDVLEPGQWFGDGPLLCSEPQPYEIQTLAPSTILLMRRTALRALLEAEAELSASLARLNWLRTTRLMRRLHDQAEPRLELRVRRQLNALVRQFGTRGGKGVHIELPLGQADLALMVQGSRQRINTVLAHLERHGELLRGQEAAAFGVHLYRHPLAEMLA